MTKSLVATSRIHATWTKLVTSGPAWMAAVGLGRGSAGLTVLACLVAGGLAARAADFNVRDYGALADDRTDNTAAFSKCMDAVVAAGGGRVVLPDGVYRGRIMIPPVTKPAPSWVTVEIVGASEPTPVFGTIGNFPLQNLGTIVKCPDPSGEAVIAARKATARDALYGNFSAVYVVIRKLDVRTADNPAISGIDLQWAMQCKIEDVFINTGVYSVQASEPTHHTSGLITPANNNAALTILRNVVVTGYHTGIVVNEHTDGDQINLACNYNGLEIVAANHASRFGRVGAQRCTHPITVTGKHGFAIQQLDIEVAGPRQTDPHNAWQATEYLIDDPGNLATADIHYWVVEGNVGATAMFTMRGGAEIRARRIGAAP